MAATKIAPEPRHQHVQGGPSLLTLNFCLLCIMKLSVAQRGHPPQVVREGRGLKDVGHKCPSHLNNSHFPTHTHTHAHA